MRWRRLFIILSLLIAIPAALFTRPRKVECITTEHTYCSEGVTSSLSKIGQSSFLLGFRNYQEVEDLAKAADPTLASLRFKRTPTWTILAVAEMSPSMFVVQADGKNYDIRANGLVRETEKEGVLLLLFSDSNQWFSPDRETVTLEKEDIATLAKLIDQFRHFSPRVTKVVFYSPEKIQLSLEGKGPVLVRADDDSWLDRQLAALQAFFRSSTMAEGYQELDARFADLVIR